VSATGVGLVGINAPAGAEEVVGESKLNLNLKERGVEGDA